MTIIENLMNASENKNEGSHWDRRRSVNGQIIEKAALTLFLERGPDNVSIADIADTAGFSRRSFFRYFRTKDEILAAMPARQMVLASQAVRERPAEESLIEAILATTRTIGFTPEEEELIGLSQQVMIQFPDTWSRAVSELRRAMDQSYEAMIKHRLTLHGQDQSSAGVIAAGLAAIVVHTYTHMMSHNSRESFADRLEQELCNFKYIGLAGLSIR